MKTIGLGAQELSSFHQHEYIYVDKTELIHRLVTEGRYYFLSRPRRFGKSLLVNTIKELYSANKDLFEGLDHWDWEQSFHVLNISFSKIQYSELGLKKALDVFISQIADQHNIQLQSTVYSGKFIELIEKLGESKPVVVLIDEYDRPIIDYFEESEFETAQANRKILKNFYAGIKDLDRYIRFFFVTGVSKFSKVSIFSDLNHLTDITIHDDYAGLLGYKQEEIEVHYSAYLKKAANKLGLTHSELLEKIKEWYDGYSWDGHQFVYNPYSVLSFLNAKSFKNYWFETGTPTFLINQLKSTGSKIGNPIARFIPESEFNKYDIDNINIGAIMFQTGYLSIKDIQQDQNRYYLDFPNKEVRDSFLQFVVRNYADSSIDEMEFTVDSLSKALENNQTEIFFKTLQSLIASITAKQLEKVQTYEGFYHSIIFIVLKLLGIRIQCEVQSYFGSTDVVIWTERFIYVIEFKMGKAQEALDQIKNRQYFVPYLTDKRQVILIGCGFDSSKRNLTEFMTENIES